MLHYRKNLSKRDKGFFFLLSLIQRYSRSISWIVVWRTLNYQSKLTAHTLRVSFCRNEYYMKFLWMLLQMPMRNFSVHKGIYKGADWKQTTENKTWQRLLFVVCVLFALLHIFSRDISYTNPPCSVLHICKSADEKSDLHIKSKESIFNLKWGCCLLPNLG